MMVDARCGCGSRNVFVFTYDLLYNIHLEMSKMVKESVVSYLS